VTGEDNIADFSIPSDTSSREDFKVLNYVLQTTSTPTVSFPNRFTLVDVVGYWKTVL
jgi:hypothetical protein